MPTAFVTGDLFAAKDLDALAHGCNCAGAMGKGIAFEFRERFPAMYFEYKDRCSRKRFVLGDVFTWQGNGVTIFNLGTQQTWRVGADLRAVEKSAREMLQQAEALGIRRIGLPRVGAGLGGLSWENDIKPLFQRLGASTEIELVVFETFVSSAG